jgi:hypothetical protein
VQDGTHLVGGQVNVRLTVVALYKSVAITVTGNDALEFREEASRRAGILMNCFDKNLFFSLIKLHQYAVEIFRGCGPAKPSVNGTLLAVPGWRNW